MTLLEQMQEIETAKNNIKHSLELKGKNPNDDIRTYSAIINSMDGDVPSAMKIKIIIQDEEPDETIPYEGIWIKSDTFTYENVYIIEKEEDVQASSVNIILAPKVNRYETVLIDSDVVGGMPYRFNGILCTDINNDILWEIPIYCGNGTDWEDITQQDSHWAGVTVDYANKIVTRIANSFDINDIACYRDRIRCNLNDNGEVTAYYGDLSYDNNGSVSNQVMVEQPIAYYCVTNVETDEDGAITKADYMIADKPKTGFEVHPLFVKDDRNYEKVYLNAYDPCVLDSKVSSVGNVTPQGGITRSTVRTYVRNRSNNWRGWTIQAHNFEILMLMIEYGTMYFRDTIAWGIGQGYTYQQGVETYPLDEHGNGRYGAIADQNKPFTYRWRTNVYGNCDKQLDNINIYNNTWYICPNLIDFTESTSNNCIAASTVACTSSGYITRFGYCDNMPWLFIPKKVSSNINDSISRDYYQPRSGWGIIRLGDLQNSQSTMPGYVGMIAYNTNVDTSNTGTQMGIGGLIYYPVNS